MEILVLYVGSYLALVVPGDYVYNPPAVMINGENYSRTSFETYRIVGKWPSTNLLASRTHRPESETAGVGVEG